MKNYYYIHYTNKRNAKDAGGDEYIGITFTQVKGDDETGYITIKVFLDPISHDLNYHNQGTKYLPQNEYDILESDKTKVIKQLFTKFYLSLVD